MYDRFLLEPLKLKDMILLIGGGVGGFILGYFSSPFNAVGMILCSIWYLLIPYIFYRFWKGREPHPGLLIYMFVFIVNYSIFPVY